MSMTSQALSPFRRIGRLLYRSANAWLDHRASTMGAAIAFYTLFSMGPVLVIAIAVAGAVFGRDQALAEFLAQARSVLGPNAAATIAAVIKSADDSGQAFWQTMLAVLTGMIAATTVFAELKGSLDVIWEVPPQRLSGLWNLLRARLLSFGIVLSIGFILLVSLIVSTTLAIVQTRYGSYFGSATHLVQFFNTLITTLVVALLFGGIFKLLPDPRVAWINVCYSALITSGLFMLGKNLIALYLATTALASSYGAAGALVLVLVWIYYSAQVFLFGAELSRQISLENPVSDPADAPQPLQPGWRPWHRPADR